MPTPEDPAVTVYHYTHPRNMESILEHGLRANQERAELESEAFLDGLRPPELIERGVSRRSVFAAPDKETGEESYRRWSEDYYHVVELQVDPSISFVAEGEYYTEYNAAFGNRPYIAEHWGRAYWWTVISLDKFRRYYAKDGSGHYVRTDDAPDQMPRSFEMPEVLIAEPVQPTAETT
jgi:hypothetical protein